MESEHKETESNTTCVYSLFFVQDPNEDTEWNDILRKKGILPPKEVPKDDEEEEELALKQQSLGKRELVISVFLCPLMMEMHVSTPGNMD